MKRKIVRLVSSSLIISVLVFPATLMAAPYYQGKVINLIVGHRAGGGNDIVARVVAKHLPKHIPGNPTVIVQNMPGASSVIAANHVYNRTKPDGLTIFGTDRILATPQLFKVESVQYDLTKFSWIGSIAKVACCFYVRTSLPHKTFDEVKAMDPIYIGGSGATGILTIMARLTKNYLLPQAKVVQTALESHRKGDTSNTSVEIWFAIKVATGNQRLNDMLDVQWYILCAMEQWDSDDNPMKALTWQDKTFVRECRTLKTQDTLDDDDANKSQRGWATVWAGVVLCMFVRSSLVPQGD